MNHSWCMATLPPPFQLARLLQRAAGPGFSCQFYLCMSCGFCCSTLTCCAIHSASVWTGSTALPSSRSNTTGPSECNLILTHSLGSLRVIAGVLVAYWGREVLSMTLLLPYVSDLTSKLIVVSAVYHTAKMVLISKDANRKWSPCLGIMRLLIDHWHLSTMGDCFITVKRIFLQGFDTLTHLMIVRDLLLGEEQGEPAMGEASTSSLWKLFWLTTSVWIVHAIITITQQRSTATLVVEVFKHMVYGDSSNSKVEEAAADASQRAPIFGGMEEGFGKDEKVLPNGTLPDGTLDSKCSSSCSHSHQACIVCHLLTQNEPRRRSD
ncbi:unnamed protein product [Chrysoparadoxa australica]